LRKSLDTEVVIVSAVRTPIGRPDGVLRAFSAIDLAGIAVREAISRAGMDPELIDLAVFGNVIPAGLGLNPAKLASERGGLRRDVRARLVNVACASGLQAIRDAAVSIALGESEVAVAGGFESISNAPLLLRPYDRRGRKLEGEVGGTRFRAAGDVGAEIKRRGLLSSTRYDGLYNPIEGKFMIDYAISYLENRGLGRESVVNGVISSYRKASEASKKGLFGPEMVEVDGVKRDELMPDGRLEELAAHPPEDLSSGFYHPQPADGAAVAVLMRGEKARKLGLKPLAKIVAYAEIGCAAADFIEAPLRVFRELEVVLGDIGRYSITEVNESFGFQIPLFEEEFKGMALNVHGGSVALGHPLGASGARLVVSLLNEMALYSHPGGIAIICYGGGGAQAMAFSVS